MAARCRHFNKPFSSTECDRAAIWVVHRLVLAALANPDSLSVTARWAIADGLASEFRVLRLPAPSEKIPERPKALNPVKTADVVAV